MHRLVFIGPVFASALRAYKYKRVYDVPFNDLLHTYLATSSAKAKQAVVTIYSIRFVTLLMPSSESHFILAAR